MRPWDGLRPTSPVNAAGDRVLPPPAAAVASGTLVDPPSRVAGGLTIQIDERVELGVGGVDPGDVVLQHFHRRDLLAAHGVGDVAGGGELRAEAACQKNVRTADTTS